MQANAVQAEVFIFRDLAKCVITENLSNTIYKPKAEPTDLILSAVGHKIALGVSVTAVTCHQFRVDIVT
jgi:hypothetical protein